MITTIIQALRPKQWIKNFIIFAPIIFSLKLADPMLVTRTIWAVATFCGISGSVYLLNDILDRERDRLHPVKCLRPIASGKLAVPTALVALVLLLILSLASSYMIGSQFLIIVVLYFINNLFYSFKIKHLVILDVSSIAFGFVLRVLAGAVAIGVPATPWLIICTILLAYFLGFAKRRHELGVIKNKERHREVLEQYSQEFLDQMIIISAACSVMSYAMYTVSSDVAEHFGTTNLIYTVPYVLYGIFRYLYLIHMQNSGGSPTKVLLTDVPLILAVLCWLGTCVAILYGG